MNSRSRSARSVRIKPSSPPSVTVVCHRPRVNHNHFKTHDNKRSDFSVNNVLKQGGSLPSVLPETNNADQNDKGKLSCISGRGCDKSPIRKEPHTASTKHAESRVTLAKKERSDHTGSSLEQKVDLLSDGLLKVHKVLNEHYQKADGCAEREIQKTKDIIDASSHLNTKAFDKQKLSDHQRYISAREYVYIVTEMNEDVHIQPYDPNEFTEGADVQSNIAFGNQVQRGNQEQRGIQAPQNSILNVNSLSDAKKAEILSAIQDELSTWRKEQEKLSEEILT